MNTRRCLLHLITEQNATLKREVEKRLAEATPVIPSLEDIVKANGLEDWAPHQRLKDRAARHIKQCLPEPPDA